MTVVRTNHEFCPIVSMRSTYSSLSLRSDKCSLLHCSRNNCVSRFRRRSAETDKQATMAPQWCAPSCCSNREYKVCLLSQTREGRRLDEFGCGFLPWKYNTPSYNRPRDRLLMSRWRLARAPVNQWTEANVKKWLQRSLIREVREMNTFKHKR